MKQSTKLLSLLLALIMAFGVMTIGVQGASLKNTVITKGNVHYDSIDNAALTPAQVATIICDLVDGLLADANLTVDAVVVTIDLTSLDKAFSSLYSTLNNVLVGSATVGDVSKLEDNDTYINGYTRSGSGDLAMLRQFIGFVTQKQAPATIAKVAYGIGTSNGLSLGIVGKFVSVDALNDIPGLLKELVFDALLYASYPYPEKYAKSTAGQAMNLDTMLNTALYNFLTVPQDKDANGDWISDSIVSQDFKALSNGKDLINLNNNSILQILDNIIQIAYNEFGTTVLNNDVKKLLMEATGVDFIEVPVANMPATALADMPATAEVKNYLMNAATWKHAGTWYFRDYVTKTTVDGEGNEVKTKVDRYFKADTSNTNAFFNLVNWDYSFADNDYSFSDNLGAYNSIFGQLNHLLYFVLKKCINPAVVDVDTIWDDGPVAGKVNSNLVKTAKWVILNYTKDIFGKNSEYLENGVASAEFTSQVNAKDSLVDLVAFIGLPFMNDAMPQLIIPDNLENGKQVLELGAVIIREFITDICPDVNYDAQIFEAGTLTSAGGRKIKTGQTNEYWYDVILNMGIDIGYTYLDQVTNFNMSVAEANEKGWGWEAKFEEVVDWGVAYINNVLHFDANTWIGTASLGAVRGTYNGNAFFIVDKVLNTILPLGFISCFSGKAYNGTGDTTGTQFEADIGQILSLIENIATNLDIEALLGVFGRHASSFNILSTYDVVETILRVVARILNCVLPGAVGTTYTTGTNATLANFTSQAALSNLISTLLTSLGTYGYAGGAETGLLYYGLLPLIAGFISDWSGEQALGTPDYAVPKYFAVGKTATMTISNGSKGIWRSGKLQDGTTYQDNQYKYVISEVKSLTSGVSVTGGTGTLDFGQSSNATISTTLTADTVAKLSVKYTVLDEEGDTLGGKAFTDYRYILVRATESDEGADGAQSHESAYSNRHVMNMDGKLLRAGSYDDLKAQLNAVSYEHSRDDAGFGESNKSSTVTASLTTNGMSSYGVTDTKYSYNTSKGAGGPWTIKPLNANNLSASTPYGRYSFTVKVTLPKTGLTGGTDLSNTIKVYYYDIESANALTDLVEDVIKENRLDTNFYTDNRDIEVTEIVEGQEVTRTVNAAAAWAAYQTAFFNGYKIAYQAINTGMNFNGIKPALEALEAALKDVDACKMSAEDLANAGAENNDAAVDALAAQLATVEETIAGRSYTDYKLYRWNRYSDTRNGVNNVINAKKAASFSVADTKYFPYYGISVGELNTLVAEDAYKNYIVALLKDYTAEEYEVKEADLANAKTNYNRYTSLDVAQLANMLDKNSSRLLYRFEDASHNEVLFKDYLNAEIASAEAMLTDSALYTAKSWATYTAALNTAKAAATSAVSQGRLFDAKYELQKARNELVLLDDEADYTELEYLMDQAAYILANPTLYDNTNAEFGAVLAELGYHTFTDAKENEINLFPGSAMNVDAIGYGTKDQKKIDRAADELKAALAKMKFKTLAVAPAAPETTVETVELEKDNAESAVTVATLPQATAKANVKTVLGLAVAGTTLTVEVSNDNHYTLNDNSDIALTGTGATVTVYTTVNTSTGTLKTPVATYRVVVKGDVNGDAVVDAFDTTVVELAQDTLGVVSLSNLFYVAANIDAVEGIGVADFSGVANIAVGK